VPLPRRPVSVSPLLEGLARPTIPAGDCLARLSSSHKTPASGRPTPPAVYSASLLNRLQAVYSEAERAPSVSRTISSSLRRTRLAVDSALPSLRSVHSLPRLALVSRRLRRLLLDRLLLLLVVCSAAEDSGRRSSPNRRSNQRQEACSEGVDSVRIDPSPQTLIADSVRCDQHSEHWHISFRTAESAAAARSACCGRSVRLDRRQACRRTVR